VRNEERPLPLMVGSEGNGRFLSNIIRWKILAGGMKMSAAFVDVHDQCLNAWDKAIISGEAGELSRFPSINYQGIFGYSGVTEIVPTSREDAVDGLGKLLSYVAGANHTAQNRIVKMRNDNEAVVSYERIISKEGHVTMTFLVLQTWRVEDGQWKIFREIAEYI
jgi:hypothetical protein